MHYVGVEDYRISRRELCHNHDWALLWTGHRPAPGPQFFKMRSTIDGRTAKKTSFSAHLKSNYS
eukprot:scaffold15628_cov115-Amphora_coffeaeformis.AAC.1